MAPWPRLDWTGPFGFGILPPARRWQPSICTRNVGFLLSFFFLIGLHVNYVGLLPCLSLLTAIWQVHCHGDLLATGSSDGHICIWQLSDKKLLHEAGRRSPQNSQDLGSAEHTGGITCLKFDPSGKFLYSGSTDKTVKIWDVETGACVETVTGHKGPVTCLDVNLDFFVSGSEDGTLRVHSAKTRFLSLSAYFSDW